MTNIYYTKIFNSPTQIFYFVFCQKKKMRTKKKKLQPLAQGARRPVQRSRNLRSAPWDPQVAATCASFRVPIHSVLSRGHLYDMSAIGSSIPEYPCDVDCLGAVGFAFPLVYYLETARLFSVFSSVRNWSFPSLAVTSFAIYGGRTGSDFHGMCGDHLPFSF